MTLALAYADLADIDDVTPRSAADDTLFAELAAVLERHNALDRFGIVLLHSHFPVHDDEMLLETTDHQTRQQLIRPVTLNELDARAAVETSWRLGRHGETRMACNCLRSPDGKTHQGHFSTG
jgi:hypothetical protein